MIHRSFWALLPVGFGLGVACSSETPTKPIQSNPVRDEAVADEDTQILGWSLFQGAGSSGAGEPLAAEIPPSTAHDCVPVGISAANPGDSPAEIECYFDAESEPDFPDAVIERRLEIVDDKRWIHLRLTFNPGFVDNTYGENAIGWGSADDSEAPMAPPPPPDEMKPKAKAKAKAKKGKGGHTFKDLVGSDHAEFQLFDAAGELTTQFKLDYIEPSDDAPSGYASAGVTGGDGKMIVGSADWILGATSSLDRNLNGCGWADYVVDSPATDATYAPNPATPTWDYRVVYEVWVLEDAFGDAGFGDARIDYVHASPSKGESTLTVVPGPCPPPSLDPPPSTSTPDAGTPTSPPEVTAPPTSTPDAGGDDPFIVPPQAR